MLEKITEKMDALDTRWLPYRRFAGLALSVFVVHFIPVYMEIGPERHPGPERV